MLSSPFFLVSGGNYDDDYVAIWEPAVKPSGYSYLNLFDDGDDANLLFHLKDYYSDTSMDNEDQLDLY